LKTGLTAYFADPCAAWQRGTSKNINGLLRRYFPKGTDFTSVAEKQPALIAEKLNNRLRKCLSYLAPREVSFEASRGAPATSIHLFKAIFMHYSWKNQ
jgi:transposase, IS30 family